MKLFPQDIDVTLYETGFEDDLLDRKAISKQLSDLVEKVDDPIVLALDGRWGSGKTYFLKRWVSAHENENGGAAITVYFDAFENDYRLDPLVSIIAAVSERIPKDQDKTLQKWKSAAAKLAKPALGVAISLATLGAKQHLEKMGDVIADAFSSEAKDASNDLWAREEERKDAMRAFKDLLTELTNSETVPIVIVVDELDRCRPDYALSVLEIIKHFFSVPKVHFILGINGDALENSVKARYGSDIDAESYLRKFINASFSLPRLVGGQKNIESVASYASQMSEKMDLPEKISGRCVNLLGFVAKGGDVSLRDVGKILSKIALLPSAASETNFLNGWVDTLCLLIVSSVVQPKFHRDFVSGTATAEEIMKFIGASELQTGEKVGDQFNSDYDHALTLWLVSMLYCCCPEEIKNLAYLPEWTARIGERFDQFGRMDNSKGIPSKMQSDFVDIFRI